ncbi:MAG: hypothetical protein ACUVWP_07640 [bacterium]
MIVYHSISTEEGFKSVIHQRDKPNILISAYFLYKRPYLRRLLPSLSKNVNSIMLDSGSISAISNGDIDWLNRTDYILYLTRNYPFHIVTNMDLPLIYLIRSRVKMSFRKAMMINIKNIDIFIENELVAKKMVILQGINISDYLYILEHLYKIGIFSENQTHIGIGSLVRRNWGYPVEIIRQLMSQLPIGLWVHAFGVGSYKRISDLTELHIRSTDTALASRTASFGKILLSGKQIKVPKTRYIHQGVIMPFNMALINYMVPLKQDNWGGEENERFLNSR